MVTLERYSTDPSYHHIEYEEEYFTKTGYEGYQDYGINTERVRKIIAIGTPKSVLDVGCAYGYIVKRLLGEGIEAIGMDISHWCEKKAAEIIPGHFVRHDIRETPYPFTDKQFDLLYCEGVLEHIEDKYIDAIMAEFDRVAHKRMLALTFDWHVKVAPYSPSNELAPGHVNLHDHNWWFEKMPDHTWLFIPATGIQDKKTWLYKC